MNNNTLYPLKHDTPTPAYLPFPWFLVSLGISNDARLLYALLFDRANLSKDNGYLEPNGTVRLYFTVKEAKEKLRRSRQVATRGLSGAGAERPDRARQAGPGPAGENHAEYSRREEGRP